MFSSIDFLFRPAFKTVLSHFALILLLFPAAYIFWQRFLPDFLTLSHEFIKSRHYVSIPKPTFYHGIINATYERPPFVSVMKMEFPPIKWPASALSGINIDASHKYPSDKSIKASKKKQSIEIYEFSYQYFNGAGAIGSSKTMYQNMPICQNVENYLYLYSTFYAGEYETVLAFSHYGTMNFGHILIDFLPIINLLPPCLLSSAHVVFNDGVFAASGVPAFVTDFLSLFGISRDQMIVLETYGYAFARQVFTVEPNECNKKSGYLTQTLRHFLAKKYQLDNVIAYRYIILNRMTPRRAFLNPAEVIDSIKSNFSDIKWEIAPIDQSIREAAIFYNSVKFIFTIHGSNVANCIFMQKGSVVTAIQTQYIDTNFMEYCLSVGVSMFFVLDTVNPYCEKAVAPFPPEVAVNLVGTALKFIENHSLTFKNPALA